MVDKHDPNRILKIGSQLEPELKTRLEDFLRSKLDVFTWTHTDMTGISIKIAYHALNIESRTGSVLSPFLPFFPQCSPARHLLVLPPVCW